MITLLPVVEVWWRDAEACQSWELLSEHQEVQPPAVRSVGMQVAKDAHKIVLCAAHSDDDINSRITIPMGCVEEYKVLVPGGELDLDWYYIKEDPAPVATAS